MLEGIFLKRLNRFAALVSIEKKVETVHIPNPGRLEELLIKGNTVLVSLSLNPTRKTRYTLKAVRHGRVWVSIDSSLPNKIIGCAIEMKKLSMFKQSIGLKREATYKCSRFDFYISEEREKGAYLEIKSVTLVKDHVAMFPDAPTKRGRRHLLKLIDAVKNGYRGVVIFCVQRPDVDAFRPYDENDPAFGMALREAKRAGVEIYAFKCKVRDGESVIDREIEVKL